MRADKQADIRKLITAFNNFANTRNKYSDYISAVLACKHLKSC